jgi:putative peptidoglycan lipid II flippase
LALALAGMPWVVAALAPGFAANTAQMDLAVALTRITFGYLLCVTIVTQFSAALNARGFFKAAAAAPILLNLGIMAGLAMALSFPSAAHAAAWGVLAAGAAEVLLLAIACQAAGIRIGFAVPRFTADIAAFLRTFWPAVIGSAGVQISLFADTILASYMASGELTSLYYADRLNQLPLGVIGIALGTVLLPEMSRRLAAGDNAGAARAQHRAMEIGLLLTLPCVALFVLIPDIIMRGLFARGAFDAQAAAAAASVLAIYGAGLPAFILIRTITPVFHARSDTVTPVRATLVSIAVNLAIKAWLISGLGWGAEGLALGTVAGAWINLAILGAYAGSQGSLSLPAALRARIVSIVLASLGSGALVFALIAPAGALTGPLPLFRQEILLLALGGIAALTYGVLVWGFGLHRR